MIVAKRYCKLIISTFAMALCFIAFSISAWADPISGALAGSMFAGGYGLAGLGTMTPGQVGDLLHVGVDPIGWDDLSPSASIHVKHKDNNKDEITLSPNLATAGERRLENLNAAWGLAPGTIHTIGNYPAVGGYVFSHQLNNSLFLGPTIGPVIRPFTSTTTYHGGTYFSSTIEPSTQSSFRIDFTAFNYGTNSILRAYNAVYDSFAVAWYGGINAVNPEFAVESVSSDYTSRTTVTNRVSLTNSGIPSTSTLSPSVNVDNGASIIDPLGKANQVTFPSSYLSDLGIPDDSTITDPDDMAEILLRLLLALMRGEIDDSIYVDPEPEPSPTPTPDETIANTQYSELEGDLGDISDAIGTGNSLLDDIKDLLGNVTDGIKGTVEDIADFIGTSNNLLDDIKDLLGNVTDGIKGTIEDISDAITNTVDGIKVGVNSIISILQGIATHVAELVQEIVNAEYNWVNGFISNFFGGFSDWFTTLRQHVSIWHYVVEWLSDISTCFSFFFGALSATGYSFILPIYAAFAGTVVIAIYRRFGR